MTPRSSRPRHSVTVTIAGEKHVLRSDAPPEYTRAVAAHVDRTVAALGDKQPLQPHRVAILAALFITDELFRARREVEQLRDEVDTRAAAMADRLQQAARSPESHPAPEPEPAEEAESQPRPTDETASG